MNRTRVSSKGQVIIPKEVRDRKRWRPGTELDVVETEDGVLLRPRNPFPPSTLEEIGRIFTYTGPAIPADELNVERIPYTDPYEGEDDDLA